MKPVFLSHFRRSHPRYSCSQERALDWLVHAHTRSEVSSKKLTLAQKDSFSSQIQKFFHRFGCSPSHLNQRFYDCTDFDHMDWERMEYFDLNRDPRGPKLEKRIGLISSFFDQAFERLFPQDRLTPEQLIHVTCTGYHSPSAPQKLIESRKWNDRHLQLLQLYHMGCYASIPAIRTAQALCQSGRSVDIAHTESCTMHIDPSQHAPEQIVVQSLFGDGNIRYRVSTDTPNGKALEVIDSREWIAPQTQNNMRWGLDSYAFSMGLSRKVPHAIENEITPFLENWFSDLGKSFSEQKPFLRFAIHPGGPKIIDSIRKVLNLSSKQCKHSYQIFKQYGNMSSATLPHIWELMTENDLSEGEEIVSLAFGPGLTIAANLMRYVK